MRPRFAALVLALAGAVACRGPRPQVVSFSHRPAPGGGSVVEVVVENGGGGEGQVVVTATLRSDKGVVERVEQDVALRGHERLRVRLPAQAAADGSTRAEVTARYPVE